MLDPDVEEADREKLVTETRTSVESAGTLVNEDTWGIRQLACAINRKNETSSRIFPGKAAPAWLWALDHSRRTASGAGAELAHAPLIRAEPPARGPVELVSGLRRVALERGALPQPRAPPPLRYA